MEVTREERLTQAFVLTGTDLKNLHTHLQRWVTNFSFDIMCHDSLTREFSTLDELLRFENPPKKDVKTLRIRAHSDDHQNRVLITLDRDSSRNVYIYIEGNEESAVAMNDSIEEALTAVKPWYSQLAGINIYIVLLAIVLVPSATVVFLVALGLVKLTAAPSFGLVASVTSIMKGLALGMMPLVFGFVLHKIQSKVFPMGVFAIGQGAKRYRDKEIVRTIVVVAFFISLVSSIITTLIFTVWR